MFQSKSRRTSGFGGDLGGSVRPPNASNGRATTHLSRHLDTQAFAAAPLSFQGSWDCFQGPGGSPSQLSSCWSLVSGSPVPLLISEEDTPEAVKKI